MNSQAQLSAAQQLASGGGMGMPHLEGSGRGGDNDDDDDIPELEAVDDDAPVDETGVEPKDIELVMQQVGCSRAKAVRVLKESGGDLINASACSFRNNAYSYPLMLVRYSHGCKRVSETFSSLFAHCTIFVLCAPGVAKGYPSLASCVACCKFATFMDPLQPAVHFELTRSIGDISVQS